MKNSISKIVLVGILGLCPVGLQARKSIQQKIERAAQQGDILTLKKLFRKLNRQKLPINECKKLTDQVLKTCGEIVESGNTSFVFFHDWKDVARVIGGSLVGIYALSRVVHDMHKLLYP